jgi:uncharacterized protein with HEPN domain
VAFFAEPLIQDAVIRNFQVVGEAAKRVPEEYRMANPQIPWRGLAAFRDVLVHQYEGVDLAQVWQVIETELPKVKAGIAGILPPFDQLEREIAGEDEGAGSKEGG